MSRFVAPLVVLLAGVSFAAPTQSSSISAEDSPPEGPGEDLPSRPDDPPGGVVVDPSGLDESGRVPPGRIREAVDAQEWDRALDLVRRRAVESRDETETGELRLLEARLLDRLGDGAASVRAYRRLLEREDVGQDALVELHDYYLRQGFFSSADDLTAHRLADAAEDPVAAALRGGSLATQGLYREAARVTAEAAARGDAACAVVRANALLALGEPEEAEALYLQVLRDATDRSVRQAAHFGLGQMARLQGGRALRALQDERAARLGPAPWAELDWGLALRALGRRDEARKRLASVAESYPELAGSAALALARLDEEAGEAEQGIDRLAAVVEGSVTDFLPLTRLGDLLLLDGREDEAVQAYRAALRLFPEFPAARERLTRALTSLGRWDEVPPRAADGRWDLPEWTWERFLEGDLPFFAVAGDRDDIAADDPRRFALVLTSLRAGHPAAALGWSADAAATGLLAIARGEALQRAGRTDEAREQWDRLAASGDRGPVVREQLARAIFAEEPERSLALWRSVIVDFPEFPRARLRMARFLAGAGRLEEALGTYRDAEGGAWMSSGEERRVRLAIEDLEDDIAERDAGAEES